MIRSMAQHWLTSERKQRVCASTSEAPCNTRLSSHAVAGMLVTISHSACARRFPKLSGSSGLSVARAARHYAVHSGVKRLTFLQGAAAGDDGVGHQVFA